MTNRFSEIYANNEWEFGSGEGSLEINTRGYRRFLQQFLARRKIASVVDMGCGDWQFSRLLDWSGVHYQGYDIVPQVIATNQERFARDGVSFQLYSGDPAELPPADLLIAKDVLQHLPDAAIRAFLPALSKYKYALLTNCVNPRGATANEDAELGGFRYLDLRLPPFSLQLAPAYTFSKYERRWKKRVKVALRGYPDWRKVVLLADNAAGG